MRNNPRQVLVDGNPMIAVSVKEFESLLAIRRQLGGQTARIRMLRDTLVAMSDFLDTLAETLDSDAPSEPQGAPSTTGPPHTGLALATEIRQHAHQHASSPGQGAPGATVTHPAGPRPRFA
ncbi:hypothetical protein [Streptomyces flavofungini]|uniref:Type II toxin-antitoxin system Phd/YefM family antitoxin n=1 Tax=Streptomyces flavofungini TaxID=68200 RepID=A0ABS0X7M1_9ACTN|nr:hypothetical protein [Streptomyces flavofungini]MBJ3809163.1 hypothetical protein [Streptomyces flavofungini]GHC68875.1 hypothetical protein GCM10010349_43410 [Streptomyces flavofungini]